MRSAWIVAAVLGLAACGNPKPPTTSPPGGGSGANAKLTAKEIYQQSSPAIVRIDVQDVSGQRVGTGFIVDKSGLVATNLHVIGGSAKIKVKLGNATELDVANIAGYDKGRDLALLRVSSGAALPTIRLGDSDTLIPGDQVVAIGNPLGFDNTVSAGLISSVRVVCTAEQAAQGQCADSGNIDLKFLQISVPISQGSSGGPLFNQSGEVIGVTTGIITQGQSINIAVPTNYLKRLLAQPGAIALDKFASDTVDVLEAEGIPQNDEEPAKIVRVDPGLTASVFDGCKFDDIAQVVTDIGQAIETGAPLYNQRTKKGYEACYRIYEGTALKWKESSPCKGVANAYGDGLLRAGTLKTYNEKAWAMRDTFDGLINAAKDWATKHPNLGPGSPAPSPAPKTTPKK